MTEADWSDVATGRGPPQPPDAGRVSLPLSPQEGTNPADTSLLDLQLPEHISVVFSHTFCKFVLAALGN